MTTSPALFSVPPRSLAAWFALLVVALGLRLTMVAQYDAQHPHAERPVIDEASYDDWAREIAAGDWLGDEVFFQEPLYPYSMAVVYKAVGLDRGRLRVVQALLGTLWVLLVALLTRRLFGSAAGWVAGALAAINGPTLLLPCLLLKPNLFLPVWTLTALLLSRSRQSWKSAAALGALLGAGVLLRGNVLVLLPLFFLWALLWPYGERTEDVRRRVHWKRALGLVLGVVLFLAPVALRNAWVGDVFVLSTSGAGTNLYGGNNAENPYGVATEMGWVRGIPEFEADDWRREAERRGGVELNPAEVSRFWMRELFASLRKDPALHLSILWNKLRLTLGAHEVPDNHDIRWDARYLPLLRHPWPGFGIIGALGLVGGWIAFSRRRESMPAVAVFLQFFAYLGTIVLTVTSGRIRLGLLPVLLPFAAICIVESARALHSRSWKSLLRITVPALVLMIALNWPVFTPEQLERDLAEREYNHAVQLLDEPGGLPYARTVAARLLAQHPRAARFRILLAETEFRISFPVRDDPDARRREDARARIQASLRRLRTVLRSDSVGARERFRASSLAGWMFLELGQPEQAARHFTRALEFDDEDFDLRLSLLQALLTSVGPGSVPGPSTGTGTGTSEKPGARGPDLAQMQALHDALMSEAPEHAGVIHAGKMLAERSAAEGR